MCGKPEPVAQRPGQQTSSSRRAHQRKRRQLEWDRGGSRSFANDDVDAEVLHGEVQHFFGGTSHAMDLVEEEHLTFGERGQHRREVARMLDRRPGRDANGLTEFDSDNHGECCLAEPWRTR